MQAAEQRLGVQEVSACMWGRMGVHGGASGRMRAHGCALQGYRDLKHVGSMGPNTDDRECMVRVLQAVDSGTQRMHQACIGARGGCTGVQEWRWYRGAMWNVDDSRGGAAKDATESSSGRIHRGYRGCWRTK